MFGMLTLSQIYKNAKHHYEKAHYIREDHMLTLADQYLCSLERKTFQGEFLQSCCTILVFNDHTHTLAGQDVECTPTSSPPNCSNYGNTHASSDISRFSDEARYSICVGGAAAGSAGCAAGAASDAEGGAGGAAAGAAGTRDLLPVQINEVNRWLSLKTWSVLNSTNEAIGILIAQIDQQPYTTMCRVAPSNREGPLPYSKVGIQHCFLDMETLDLVNADAYIVGKLVAKMYGPTCALVSGHRPENNVDAGAPQTGAPLFETKLSSI